MPNADRSRQQDPSPPLAAHAPTGWVISVLGSQASIGPSNSPLHDPSPMRATVGKFLGIFSRESDRKTGAKGTAAFYDVAAGQTMSARMELEQRLRLAIRDRRFCCAFQPK